MQMRMQMQMQMQLYEEKEKETENKKENKNVYKYDCIALFAMIASIYLLYLAYQGLNNLVSTVSGNTISELSNEVKSQLHTMLQTLKPKTEDMTFWIYVYTSFTSFSSEIITSQQERIQHVIQTVLQSKIPDFSNQIKMVCFTQQTGWTGYIETFTKGILTTGISTQCVTSMTSNLVVQYLNEQQFHIHILLTGLQSTTLQLNKLFLYGVSLGYASFSYFFYRICKISMYTMIQQEKQQQPLALALEDASETKLPPSIVVS
jgi:hypothetical protein